MSTEELENASMQVGILDHPVDKMDDGDGVVVVVESGGIESGEDAVVERDEQGETSKENFIEQEESQYDDHLELIKVALAAEQDVALETNIEKNNGEANNSDGPHCQVDGTDNDVEMDESNKETFEVLESNVLQKKTEFVRHEGAGSTNEGEGQTKKFSGQEMPSCNNFNDEGEGDVVNDGNQKDIGDGEEEPNVENFSQNFPSTISRSKSDVKMEHGGNENFNMVMITSLDDIDKKEFNDDSTVPAESDEKMLIGKFANYVCEQCGKRFTHVSSKKRHMLKHREGDPPVVYQCLACSKTFQYNSSLKRHLKLHSEETAGKAYTCEVCSKAFMYATSLKRHLKIHSGKEIYPCPQCQRCFEYISSLKRHERLHSEGKGFKCDVCSKSFGYLTSLTRHLRVHQKSLTCEKCNKDFRLYKSYLKHLEEHGEILGEAELAAMKVEEDDEEISYAVEGADVLKTTGNEEMKPDLENNVADVSLVDNSVPSLAVENGTKSTDEKHLDAIQGDVIDLQSAENHPFVKFVVSQNTVTLEQLQAFQAAQASSSSEGTAGQDSIAYAVVQTDGSSLVGENCMVADSIQEIAGNQVGGIVLVELDQDSKVTERHVEGLQASNLLQLLQAVEGFAVENNSQTEQQEEPAGEITETENQIETDSRVETEHNIEEEGKKEAEDETNTEENKGGT